MGKKRDELYARIAECNRGLKNYTTIPEELFQAALAEERTEGEATEDQYYDEVSAFLDKNPIGHPRLCGPRGYVFGKEDDPE